RAGPRSRAYSIEYNAGSFEPEFEKPRAARNRCCADRTRRRPLMVPLSWYLILSAILFAMGVVGFLVKRNIITIFMSIELMLNAVNLSFVAFANYWNQHGSKLALSGQVFVFFVMLHAAPEAAVG